ncbi:MAG: zinc ribbon domain-containing protein [Thermomicrobiales bacterium]
MTVPPLVSADDFDAVQTRLAANKRLATRNNRTPEATLLRAGFVRCGYCGHNATVHNGGRGGPAYKCQGWAKDEHGCPCFSIKSSQLDAIVWAKVEAILTNPEIVAEQVTLLRQRDPVADDLTSIDRRLAAIPQQQQRFGRAIATLDDDDAAAPLLIQLRYLASEKQRLIDERARLESQRAGWQTSQARLDDISRWCFRVAGNLPRLTYAEKRDLLTALDVRIMLYRTDHTPRWEISIGLDGIVSGTDSSSAGTSRGSRPGPPRRRSTPKPR